MSQMRVMSYGTAGWIDTRVNTREKTVKDGCKQWMNHGLDWLLWRMLEGVKDGSQFRGM